MVKRQNLNQISIKSNAYNLSNRTEIQFTYFLFLALDIARPIFESIPYHDYTNHICQP